MCSFSAVFYGLAFTEKPLARGRLTLLLCALLNAAAHSAICLSVNLLLSDPLENCHNASIMLFSVAGVGRFNGYHMKSSTLGVVPPLVPQS